MKRSNCLHGTFNIITCFQSFVDQRYSGSWYIFVRVHFSSLFLSVVPSGVPSIGFTADLLSIPMFPVLVYQRICCHFKCSHYWFINNFFVLFGVPSIGLSVVTYGVPTIIYCHLRCSQYYLLSHLVFPVLFYQRIFCPFRSFNGYNFL